MYIYIVTYEHELTNKKWWFLIIVVYKYTFSLENKEDKHTTIYNRKFKNKSNKSNKQLLCISIKAGYVFNKKNIGCFL